MRGRLLAIVALFLAAGTPTWAATPQELLGRIKAIGTEGKGNGTAAAAWRELVEVGPPALIPILREFDDKRLVVVNWLRPAVDAIAEKAARAGRKLPVEELEPFLVERANPPLGRAAAYELLTQTDPTAADRWAIKFLDDPSPDLRRVGVARALSDGEQLIKPAVNLAGLGVGLAVSLRPGATYVSPTRKAAVLALFEKALTAACDPDQVDSCVTQLAPLGRQVDVAKKYGFVREWALVTPFDNTEMKGFAVAYPPEKAIDLKAGYDGKDGIKGVWGSYASTSAKGVVDLKEALGPLKGTIAYGYTVVESPTERPIEIRLGTYNATRIWLNGQEVFAHEEYHHGMSIDQYSCRATLKAGKNELLIKVCQNEQNENWAQSWMFQLRLCDSTGAAVPFTVKAPELPPVRKVTPKNPKNN